MHATLHPLQVAGWALVLGAGAVYLGGIAAALLRVRRQYSSAITGSFSIHLGAAIAAAERYWPLLLPMAIGIVVLKLG